MNVIDNYQKNNIRQLHQAHQKSLLLEPPLFSSGSKQWGGSNKPYFLNFFSPAALLNYMYSGSRVYMCTYILVNRAEFEKNPKTTYILVIFFRQWYITLLSSRIFVISLISLSGMIYLLFSHTCWCQNCTKSLVSHRLVFKIIKLSQKHQ